MRGLVKARSGRGRILMTTAEREIKDDIETRLHHISVDSGAEDAHEGTSLSVCPQECQHYGQGDL